MNQTQQLTNTKNQTQSSSIRSQLIASNKIIYGTM